ncbi:MAG: PRTRC system ThiF family protein [Bryobacterales bacterium]|nr:PRTRC system ThiF family protein [Bryobacterales bacterium]
MHQLPDDLLRRPIRVLVVGCGGNGSAIAAGLPYLHQALLVHGHRGGLDVTLMDGDVVSPTNCVRQPFSQTEIGHFKAVVLASRLNLFWGLNWKAIPNHLSDKTNLERTDILIGCVDTRATRRLIERMITGPRNHVSYWLDLGNHATGGQYVLGQPWNWVNKRSAGRLRTIAELFPDMVDASLDDESPSCSSIEALTRQEPFVNTTLANHALALLARLFRYGSLNNHGAFVNVAQGRVQPLVADPLVWRAMRRRARRWQSSKAA